MSSRHILAVVAGFLVVALIGVIAITWRPWQWWHPDRRWGPWMDKRDQTFVASDGTSSQYHVFAAGLSPETVTGIIFQFHGDGAYEFTHPDSSYSLGGRNGIVEAGRSRGYVVVAVLSPDERGEMWWEDGEANAAYANELVTSLTQEYAPGKDNTWLVGYSGGSQFITQFFLPLYSSTLRGGGAIMFGGGGRPDPVDARPFADSLRAHFPMFWYTGAADDGTLSDDGYDALGDVNHGAKAGEAYYRQAGFVTGHFYPAGVTHDLSQRFGGVVADQLDQHPR